MDGKSDRLDVEQDTRAMLDETSTAAPTSKSGVESSGPSASPVPALSRRAARL